MDTATHALEQMSLTITISHPFTTQLSLSLLLSIPHPPSVINTIHLLCSGTSCTTSPTLPCICMCNTLTPTLTHIYLHTNDHFKTRNVHLPAFTHMTLVFHIMSTLHSPTGTHGLHEESMRSLHESPWSL